MGFIFLQCIDCFLLNPGLHCLQTCTMYCISFELFKSCVHSPFVAHELLKGKQTWDLTANEISTIWQDLFFKCHFAISKANWQWHTNAKFCLLLISCYDNQWITLEIEFFIPNLYWHCVPPSILCSLFVQKQNCWLTLQKSIFL